MRTFTLIAFKNSYDDSECGCCRGMTVSARLSLHTADSVDELAKLIAGYERQNRGTKTRWETDYCLVILVNGKELITAYSDRSLGRDIDDNYAETIEDEALKAEIEAATDAYVGIDKKREEQEKREREEQARQKAEAEKREREEQARQKAEAEKRLREQKQEEADRAQYERLKAKFG